MKRALGDGVQRGLCSAVMPRRRERFEVVEGGNRPLPGTRRRHKDDEVLLLCRTCEAATGTATSTWVEGRSAPMERAGRVTGGDRVLICAGCLARGKVTVAP